MSTALTTRPDAGFLVIDTFEQAQKVADYINKSALVPDAYRGKPADIVIAMQYGMELGLSPMQSLQSVAVINGRPTIWGDALPAVVMQHHDFEDLDAPEPTGSDPETWVASCTVRRRGRTPITRTFSTVDAKLAGLWKKSGPWSQYPKVMLMNRARAFALRAAFPDRMKGIITAEEAIDITPVAPTASEPRRLSETAPTSAPPLTSVSPTTDAASPGTPPAVASASPAETVDELWTGVKVLDTKWVADSQGGYGEVTTTKGVMMTRTQGIFDEEANCEDSGVLLKVSYRFGKRKNAAGKEERVNVLIALALDEGPQPQQPESGEA